MNNKKGDKKRGTLAISQIIVLVISIFAIAYALGGGIELVSAETKVYTTPGDPYEYQYVDGQWQTKGGPNDRLKNWVDVNEEIGGILNTRFPEAIVPTKAVKTNQLPSGMTLPANTFGDGPSTHISEKPENREDTQNPPSQEKDKKGTSSWDIGKFATYFIFEKAGIAMGIYQTTKFIIGLFSDDASLVDAASKAISMGYLSAQVATKLFAKKATLTAAQIAAGETAKGGVLATFLSSTAAWGIGAAVTIIVFISTYEKTKQEVITFTCYPWEAPIGGSNCDKCNNLPGDLPCSEYQCRSLGQACQLINPGTSEEKCVWQNPDDVTPPVIEPWIDALISKDYEHNPDNTLSPPDRGVKIIYKKSTDKCIPAFTPLSFGINIVGGGVNGRPEPAKCKIDITRRESFDEMQWFFGGNSLLRYNHTQVMSLPGPDAFEAENLTINNNGEFELYVRCQDANGNSNVGTFVFKYCVDQGPDTTAPIIVTTDILNNFPIKYEQTSFDLGVYVNEPSNCKWGKEDKSFNEMENSMKCSNRLLDFNAQMLYRCDANLTGLNDGVENKFYFRCKDKSNGNSNAESYKYTLIGTQPLVINDVEPDNETIRDSTDNVKVTLEVETGAGYKEGESTCYYSETGESDNYIAFFETDSYQHVQDLYLPEGDYIYFIKCQDLGGNIDIEEINFYVETDGESPTVVRAYKDETNLKIVTNEEASCVYSTFGCNYLFEDGTKMVTLKDVEHYADWNTKVNYYIKCSDRYNNQPAPDKCNIIVNPFGLFQE